MKKKTIEVTLNEIRKIRVVEMNTGNSFLTEISKKQKTLFDKLQIPLPKNIVIKNGEF